MIKTTGKGKLDCVSKVAYHFERAILRGELQPGDRLPSERAISAEMNVSRTAVREALGRLQSLGLISRRHGSGTRVLPPDSTSVRSAYERSLRQWAGRMKDVYEVRLLLEAEIAALAARNRTAAQIAELEQTQNVLGKTGATLEERARADMRFHMVLAEATGNPMFPVVLAPVQDVLMEMTRRKRSEWPDKAAAAHERILAAVRAGDSEAAAGAMRDHLNYRLERIAELPLNGRGPATKRR